MKTIKPENLSLLFKSFVAGDKCLLSLSACACFTLDVQVPNRLLNEQDMWPVIEAALGKDELFDFGMPKVRGEYLVYGSAFAAQAVRAVEVSVRIDALEKTLQVFGDRCWTLAGPEAPAPFMQMPIHYGNAYGGEAFPLNPQGKGYGHDASGRQPLPNVQAPSDLVASPGDRPHPAGFTAYPMTWPQRQRYLGKFGKDWLLNDWPHFPKDTNWEYFNTAPDDQRLKEYLRGDEAVAITRMHPGKALIASVLPALRPRLFVHQREKDAEVFREVPCRAETLWLFPDREVGILLYRGTVPVADEEYEDVLHLYGQWESMAETPGTIEEYSRMFQKELAPEMLSAEATPAAQEPAPAPPQAAAAVPSRELAALVKQVEAMEAQTIEWIKKIGLDPAAVMAQAAALAAPQAPAGGFSSLEEVNKGLADLEKQTAEFMKKFGIKAADVEKVLAPKPDAPLKSTDQLIADLRKAGFHNQGVEAQLHEAEKLLQDAQAGLKGLEKEAAKAAPPPPEERPTEQPAVTAKLTAEDVMARHRAGESLRGLDLKGCDLSGQDLSGADFTGAAMDKTSFSKAVLRKAIFHDAILMEADFSEARMEEAVLTSVNASRASFVKTHLDQSDLSQGDFTDSDFSGAFLKGAALTDTVFEKCNLTDCHAEKVMAVKADFTAADLTNADFRESDLTEADLSGAMLDKAVLADVRAGGLRLFAAKGERPVFERAFLKASRADGETEFKEGQFDGADLSRSCWEGAKLNRCRMTEAVLDQADFSKADFSGSVLITASAKEANFMKANLGGASLMGINLFKGSLRKADLSGTDLRHANLYGVDFYKARLVETNLKNANLKKTLLTLRVDL